MIHSAQRILIVEDNKTEARLIRDLLERYGYETLLTGDGFAAMKLALECSGCDAYISKPFSIFSWLHTVGSFLPRSPH